MNAEKEEKLLKSLGLFVLLVFIPLNTFILKDVLIKAAIFFPLLIAFIILYFRKYIRDKKEDKDLTFVKAQLIFLLISFLLILFFLIIPNL